MHIEKRKLNSVDKNQIIKLLNNPLVKRHMPLSVEDFGDKQYLAFIASKAAIWEEYGFGPSAYFIEKKFAGWGGIQPDEKDFELALVLDPAYWGYGRQLYHDLIQEAFVVLKLNSVTILFPPSRTRIKWILKAGFVEEDRTTLEGECFIRFRLKNPTL
jgi:[ribosomal protein S5]-alanine N-acetyltransferase